MPKNPKPLTDEVPTGPVPLDLSNPDIDETLLTIAANPKDLDLFAPESTYDENEDESEQYDDDEDDEDEDETEFEPFVGIQSQDEEEVEAEDDSVPVVTPVLPAVLMYDSTSHGKRRYYVNSLKGKPVWAYDKEHAFVFDNLDHIKLAGGNCHNYGYSDVTWEAV